MTPISADLRQRPSSLVGPLPLAPAREAHVCLWPVSLTYLSTLLEPVLGVTLTGSTGLTSSVRMREEDAVTALPERPGAAPSLPPGS